jgi:DNA-binding protein HU-beta
MRDVRWCILQPFYLNRIKTMQKPEFVKHLSDETKLSKADIERVLDAQERIVQSVMTDGGEITLPGICKISVVDKAARTGRNPQTGEPIELPAHKAPKFKAVKALKEAV